MKNLIYNMININNNRKFVFNIINITKVNYIFYTILFFFYKKIDFNSINIRTKKSFKFITLKFFL